MTTKKQINLRMKEEQIERLRAQAEKENRSVNNLIECIIEKYLAEQDKKKK